MQVNVRVDLKNDVVSKAFGSPLLQKHRLIENPQTRITGPLLFGKHHPYIFSWESK